MDAKTAVLLNDEARPGRTQSGSQHTSHESIRCSPSVGRLTPRLTQLHADDGLGFQILQREAEGWFPLFMSTGAQSTCPSPQGPLSGRPGRFKTTLTMRPKPNVRKATAVNRARDTLLEKKRSERGPRPRRITTEPRALEGTKPNHNKPDRSDYINGKHHHHHLHRPLMKRQPRFGPRQYCHTCGRTATPQWRRGPHGLGTLCNICGLIWGKRWTADHDLGSGSEFHVVLSPRVAMANRQGLRWTPPT